MKKQISLLCLVILTSCTCTGVPLFSRLLYDKGSISIPNLILITGMVIITIVSFLKRRQKNKDGKDGSSSMVWPKPLGSIGLLRLF